MKRTLIAHSPDADDIFMYYAIKFGWVDMKNTLFDNIAKDIQTLNEDALNGVYDIVAISFALYPHIKEEYAPLRTAVSFGEGYGPKLIKKKGVKLKRNFKVALSGKHTTNAMLFRIAYPDARITYMNFLEIEQAVLDGKVDAGVLIHESILTYDDALEVEREMWDIWQELAGDELPLPLGGMAIRRSLPLNKAIDYEATLTKAVQVARDHKDRLSKMLIERDLVRIDAPTLDKYLELYANDDSITLSDIQYRAIDKLFELGYKHGFYDSLVKIEDFMISILSPEFYWYVSSPYYQFLGVLAKELRTQKRVKIYNTFFEVAAVNFVPVPEFSENEAQFTCLSPMTVLKKEGNNGHSYKKFIFPDQEDFYQILENDLKSKFKLINKKEIDNFDFNIEFDQAYVKRKNNRITKVITLEGDSRFQQQVRCVLAPFKIKAEPEILQMIYDTGIGQMNSMGFGMVEIVDKKKNIRSKV